MSNHTTTRGRHRKPRGRSPLPIVAALAVLALAVVGACSTTEADGNAGKAAEPVAVETVETLDPQPEGEFITAEPEPESEPTPEPEPEPEPEESDSAIDNATVGETNAMLTALDYLDFMGFSEPGLADQLEYEGYTAAEIEFALSQITVDWKAEAVEAAQDYLDFTSFSRSGLIDQLLYEGFTQAQAEHAVDQVGL